MEAAFKINLLYVGRAVPDQDEEQEVSAELCHGHAAAHVPAGPHAANVER